MSIESPESTAGREDHSPGWDDPQSVGWQVWRRTQSTGLLAQRIQRQLTRPPLAGLSSRNSLASEILRRWGIGGRGVSFGSDLPLFFGRVRGLGVDRLHPVSTEGLGVDRRPTSVVHFAEPVRASSVAVNPRPPGVATAPSVGVNRWPRQTVAETSARRPAADSGSPVTPPSAAPRADVFVRAPDTADLSSQRVADTSHVHAPLPSAPAGDVLISRRDQGAVSERPTLGRPPETLPVSARHVVAPRTETVGQSIARSADGPEIARPTVPMPEREGGVAAPTDAQLASVDRGSASVDPRPASVDPSVDRGPASADRAPISVDRAPDEGAPDEAPRTGVVRSISFPRHTLLSPAGRPPGQRVLRNRRFPLLTGPAIAPTIPLVAFRRHVGFALPTAAGARAIPSPAWPFTYRALAPAVSATAARAVESLPETPTSRGATVLRRRNVPGEPPGGGGVLPTDRPAPSPPTWVAQARPSVTSREAYEPNDSEPDQPTIGISPGGERDIVVTPVARSVSSLGGPDPVLPADRPGVSQESVPSSRPAAAEFDLTRTRPGPVRISHPFRPLLARSFIEPGTIFRPSELRYDRAPGGQRLLDDATTPHAATPHAATPSGGSDSAMLVTTAIGRRPALESGYKQPGQDDRPGSLPGGLLLYRSDLMFETIARARASIERAAGRATPTTVIARSVDMLFGSRDPSADVAAAAPAFQPADLPSVGHPAGRTSSGTSEDVFSGRPRAGGLPPMLLALRSMTTLPPAIMRTSEEAPHGERQHAAAPATAGGSDLLLVARTTVGADGRVMAVQRANGFAVPSAPPASVGGGRGLPVGAGVDVRGTQAAVAGAGAGAPAAGGKTQIDLDELVEKTWQKLMRKVAIEQERRGYTRWPWQS